VPGRKGVMVLEVPGRRLGEDVDLGSHAGRAICASTRGLRWPAIIASSIARPETPNRSLITLGSLIWAA
jgi:hypothetical protein